MNKTAKSFSIVTGFSILTRLVGFLYKIWMSRALGAETVGVYHIATSVIFMLFTLTAGAPTVLSRKVAEAVAKGDSKRANALACASMLIGLTTAGVLVALSLALKSHLGIIFSNPDCIPIFLILTPTLVTSTLYASLRSWFWGHKKFVSFSSTELLDEVTKLILSVVFAGGITSFCSPSQGVALAMTISDFVCVVVLAVMFFIAGGRMAKPSGFKELLKSMVPLSATRILTSTTLSLVALVIPKLLASSGLSMAEATAEYGRVAGMALPLIMAPITLVSSLSIVFIPDVAGLRAQGKMSELRGKLSTLTLFSLIIAATFFALYLPLGEGLGELLFKDAEAGKYVSYCSVLLFPVALANATTPMLNSLGKEKNTLITTVAGGVVCLPLILLTKVIGSYAIALCSGTCFLVTAILNCIVLHKEIGSFADAKKCLVLILLFLPLAISGYFGERLLGAAVGNVTSVIVISVYTLFFAFLLINAFDIVDVVGFLRLLKPAKVASHRSPAGEKRNKNPLGTRRMKRLSRRAR